MVSDSKEKFIALCVRQAPKYMLRIQTFLDRIWFLCDGNYSIRFRIANLILGDRLRIYAALLLSAYMRNDRIWCHIRSELYHNAEEAFGFKESYLKTHTFLYGDGYDSEDTYGTRFLFSK